MALLFSLLVEQTRVFPRERLDKEFISRSVEQRRDKFFISRSAEQRL